MVLNFLNGKIVEAQDMQLDSLNLIKALFSEVNPIPVKASLNMLGYNVGIPRLPLVEMSEIGKEKLEKELKNFELL